MIDSLLDYAKFAQERAASKAEFLTPIHALFEAARLVLQGYLNEADAKDAAISLYLCFIDAWGNECVTATLTKEALDVYDFVRENNVNHSLRDVFSKNK